jgi:WD40 repeat protein
MLLNCVAEKTNAHSDIIRSVAFSPDGTKIVSGSADGTIKVWDSGARRKLKIVPLWPKLKPAGLSGRQTGAVEREDERPQRHHPVGGVFPGRDQECVGIVRREDQSLGFRCAGTLKIAPPWPKLTPAGCLAGKLGLLSEKTNAHSHNVMSVAFSPDGTKIVSGSDDKTIKVWDSGAPKTSKSPSLAKTDACWLSGSQTGAAEREDLRPQPLRHVGGVFPGRDQDCVRIGRQDDQSLGSGQLVSQRSFDVQSYHTAIRLAAAVAEQMQHEVS